MQKLSLLAQKKSGILAFCRYFLLPLMTGNKGAASPNYVVEMGLQQKLNINLSPNHKDPFDRLIIATALEYGVKLASVDSLFSKYPELESYLM
ncbi:MAG: hypothetical protein WCQ26_03205 [Pseudanabaena sp. ELA748]